MVEENQKFFNAPMDPFKQLAFYTENQEYCQAFAADAGKPISMSDKVQMGVTHAMVTIVIHNGY